jgi:hypothetical protein
MMEPRLLPFSEIRIGIKRIGLLKLYNSDEPLTFYEYRELSRDLAKLKDAQYRINHAVSIVEKIMLRYIE